MVSGKGQIEGTQLFLQNEKQHPVWFGREMMIRAEFLEKMTQGMSIKVYMGAMNTENGKTDWVGRMEINQSAHCLQERREV